MNFSQLPLELRPARTETLLSVVLPAFNESGVLHELHEQLTEVLIRTGCSYEILFVNDGSSDDSDLILDTLAVQDPCVRVLHFSRNFGHQAALQAGIAHARGDAVIIMDADLQDDPAAILQFVDQWLQGYEVVYAVREKRKERGVKKLLFYSFYRLLNAVAQTRMPMDAGNFGLIDRAVAQQLMRIGDCHRYFPGLRSWVGFRQTGVRVERGRRYDDRPRVSVMGLCRLAKTAIFSFSTVPLSAFYVIALLSWLTCLGLMLFATYHKLVTGLALPGWTSLMMVASFFGALNALGIGILGEYAIRIYDQVRGRPNYIVARAVNFEAEPLRSSEDALLEWLADNWRTSQLTPAAE